MGTMLQPATGMDGRRCDPCLTFVWGAPGSGKTRLLRTIAGCHAAARYVVLADLVEELLWYIGAGEPRADLCGSAAVLAVDDASSWAEQPARRKSWDEMSMRLVDERVVRGKSTWIALDPESQAAQPLIAAVEEAEGLLAHRGVRRIVLRSPSRRRRMTWLVQQAAMRGLRPDHALVGAIAGDGRPWSLGTARGQLLTSAFASRYGGHVERDPSAPLARGVRMTMGMRGASG
jgi:hypothetical protein